MTDKRKLIDLVSVGPAILAELKNLGITEVDHLITQDAVELFDRLQGIKGNIYLDRCCEDVFRCAIEQARDPELPKEKCQWHYWSKVRKGKIKQ